MWRSDPLTVKPNLESTEHIRRWTRLVEKRKRQTEREKKRETECPIRETANISTLFYCRIQAIFFFLLSFSSSVYRGNNSELYVLEIHKSLPNLLSCCGACRVPGAALWTTVCVCSINLLNKRRENRRKWNRTLFCFLGDGSSVSRPSRERELIPGVMYSRLYGFLGC